MLRERQGRSEEARELYQAIVEASISALAEKYPRTKARADDLRQFRESVKEKNVFDHKF
jgi:hypothetical protein